MALLAPSGHVWNFFRAGGLDQVALQTGQDLLNLQHLDQKLWVALACPTKGLEIDERTLNLIDTGGDGRIRVPELLAAIQWAAAHLKSVDTLINPKATDGLKLAEIGDAAVLASAKQMLAGLGKPAAEVITVGDAADVAKAFATTKFNGDGVITPDSAPDAALAAVIGDILATVGGKPDRSGKAGVDQATVDAFFAQLAAYEAWTVAGEALPQGPGLGAAAVLAWKAVRTKVEDYFARCRLAAYDARAAAHLNRPESEYAALASKDLSTLGADVAALPLAKVEAGRPLPLREGVNPAWAGAMAAFVEAVVTPLHGAAKTTLTAAEWAAMAPRLAPYEAWSASMPATPVAKLPRARIQELLKGDAKAELAKVLAQDLAVAPEFAAIEKVERLARYHRDLYRLIHNFVNFSEFYNGDLFCIFQAGTLYLDTRSMDLCIRVEDMGKHGVMAPLSRTYLLYCDCTRKDGGKMSIVAALTNGDADNIMVGRNGLFYDRQGRDWDATVVKIVEAPVSIRAAFWSPYTKAAQLIGDQIEKLAAAREKSQMDKMAGGIEGTAQAVDKGTSAAAVPAQPPMNMANMVGMLAGVGLAIGAVGGALGGIAGIFVSAGLWSPLIILGLMFAISGPSMLLAYLKLRKRVLGPLLDANGWAINGRVKINLPLGGSLTRLAKLPFGAIRKLEDPYAEKKQPTWLYVLFALFVVFVLVRQLTDTLDFIPWLFDSGPAPAAAAAPEAAPATPAPAPAP